MFEATHTWVEMWWALRGSPLAMQGPLGDRMLVMAEADDAETVETLVEMDLAFESAQSEKADTERQRRG